MSIDNFELLQIRRWDFLRFQVFFFVVFFCVFFTSVHVDVLAVVDPADDGEPVLGVLVEPEAVLAAVSLGGAAQDGTRDAEGQEVQADGADVAGALPDDVLTGGGGRKG